MGVLSVQIGQCGNQLGFEYFDLMYRHICNSRNEDFKNKLTSMYFNEEYQYGGNVFPVVQYEGSSSTLGNSGGSISTGVNCTSLNNYVARCILIDMEPKVVERCLYGCSTEKILRDGRFVRRKKKKGRHNVGGEHVENGENNQQYVCGLDEYYEQPNNFLKIFKRDTLNGSTNKQDHFDNYNMDDVSPSVCDQSDEEILDYEKGYNREEYMYKKKKEYMINQWKYSDNNFICGLNGSGNNWSYGFNVHAKNICEHFLNLMNKELEKNETNECIDNIILFHSLAGGSGSGISSYISYILKDEYPKINLFNICILPYMFGEISVQSLNSILCLSSLYDVSDCLVLFENDKFELMCKRINNVNIDTNDINKYISLFLAYTIGLPIDTTQFCDNRMYTYSNIMDSVVSDLCCHPNYKLLSTRYLPQVFKDNMKFEHNSFNMLLKRMHKMVIKGCILDSDVTNGRGSSLTESSNINNYFARLSQRGINKCSVFRKNMHIPIYLNGTLNNSHVCDEYNSILLKMGAKGYPHGATHPHGSLRGNRIRRFANTVERPVAQHYNHNNVIFSSKMIMRGDVNENIDFGLFKNHVLYNNTSLSPIEVYVDHNKEFTHNTLAMISNCLTPIPTLKKILQNAKMLYSTNAYIYQYNNYGVTHDHIHSSLMALEQIIHSYERLSCE
ncbi:delta tubulin, putative [Plasmodium ovale]|uniref:Tubulin delta chain n=1 Tax=Plasmodium ovale TaxID=36330 RepID=A0A1C3KR02_PLAOA|nr:delta tubulin, putative [Plasmodium ovale]